MFVVQVLNVHQLYILKEVREVLGHVNTCLA